jgi:TPR repeat protein
MNESIAKRLMDETEVLHKDDASQWSAVEALWQPYIAQNDVEAQFRLAYYYLFYSFDEEPQKRAEMEKLLRTAAERAHPDAVYWLSRLYPKGAERDSSLLLRAGELGSLEGQRDLGALYATGDWTGPRDSARAAEWYRRAAERDHEDAQYNLGFMYLLGEGVPKDTKEGLRWLLRAADQGDEMSIRLLADLYQNGHYGVPLDPAEAERWDKRYRQSELYRMFEEKRAVKEPKTVDPFLMRAPHPFHPPPRTRVSHPPPDQAISKSRE